MVNSELKGNANTLQTLTHAKIDPEPESIGQIIFELKTGHTSCCDRMMLH